MYVFEFSNKMREEDNISNLDKCIIPSPKFKKQHCDQLVISNYCLARKLLCYGVCMVAFV